MAEIESVEIDSAGGTCFLTNIENDIQQIFDHLCRKFRTKCILVKNLLKIGNMYHKGDFFLSLRSEYAFLKESLKDELLDKLSEIPYVCRSEIDNGILILYLNRTILFKGILKDVMKSENSYGMTTTARTFLILVHNEVFKNFDSLRIALIADHLISFLTATGAKVLVNEYRRDAELAFKQVPTYACTDHCLEQIKLLGELIKNSAQDSKWASITDTENIFIDFKKFKTFSLSGKDSDSITIDKNNTNIVVNQGAYTLHFQYCHMNEIPDSIIHICSHSQRRKIIDSGVLMEILGLIETPQYFIICQSTVFKDQPEVTIDAFMNKQKQDVESAMIHKFNSSTLQKEMWDCYLKNLIDTAMKFYFFKAGTNVPLKIDFSLNESNVNNKDGIFIQYNFARLSNLLKNFEIKVEEGYYEKLPALDKIDFRLLKFEEEWNLLSFVLAFPRLVQEIFWSINSKHVFLVNKVCKMLTKLCRCFSRYYSRIHVLVGPQPQLQKVMHARLWLLKSIHQIMQNSFNLLNIEGLNKM